MEKNKRVTAMLQHFGVRVAIQDEPDEPVFTCLTEQHIVPLAEMIDAEATVRVLDELFTHESGRIDINLIPPVIAERIKQLRLVSSLVLHEFDKHFPLIEENDNGSENSVS